MCIIIKLYDMQKLLEDQNSRKKRRKIWQRITELESECICFVALDAAAKAAAVKIQGVERNRLAAGACVKMRGSVSDVKAAMEAALDVARPLTKIVSHTVIASPSEDTEKAIAMTINK